MEHIQEIGASSQTLHEALQKYFGFDAFKGNQEPIIQSLLEGKDTFVIMPTGGGKSLCYQLPAMMLEGTALIISPLIALMKNQVDSIRGYSDEDEIAHFLNSSLSRTQMKSVKQDIIDGKTKMLYIAPETLTKDENIEFFQNVNISFVAVDEAHCISEWGHDFRPEYRRIKLMIDAISKEIPVIALTATATPKVQSDILKNLGMELVNTFVSSFNRDNLFYEVRPKGKKDQTFKQIVQIIKTVPNKSGIIYVQSRKSTEEIAQILNVNGIKAAPYHAGLEAKVRSQTQDAFLMEEIDVIVATIAFGMGIDKPDVRFVIHYDIPKSIENYYQETGRAGRDGEPATALLLYGLEDVVKLRQMMAGSEGSEMFKRQEQQRLQAMLGLCEITSCRRQTLLRYFGDQLDEPCGNCDSCLHPAQTWDATEAVRMALSCVYRTGQRFGAGHVIDVLRGSTNDKIISFDHHKLSTYGIGKHLSADEWRSVFRQLVARGYLDVDASGFGSLLLNDACRPILRGEQSIQLRRDIKTASASLTRRAPVAVAPEDEGLWYALRACRKRLAEEHGVPPYVIFHDSTLREMLEQRPLTSSEMLSISGVGDSKLERFGDEFLEVIREYEYA